MTSRYDESVELPDAHALFGLPRGRKADALAVIPADALVKREDGGFTYKKFTLTANGMEIPAGISGDEWVEVGQVIKSLEDSVSWVIGDWAAYANEQWDTPYETIAAEFGYEEETLFVYASVCRAVPTLIRNQGAGMSMGHARAFAKFDQGTQLLWATYWSHLRPKVADLKKDVSAAASAELTGEALAAALSACVEQGELLHHLFAPTLGSGDDPKPLTLPDWSDGRKITAKQVFNRLEGVVNGELRPRPSELARDIALIERWLAAIRQAKGGGNEPEYTPLSLPDDIVGKRNNPDRAIQQIKQLVDGRLHLNKRERRTAIESIVRWLQAVDAASEQRDTGGSDG